MMVRFRFTRLAGKGMESGNMAVKGENIGRAMAIISEFSKSLNFEIGGKIAEDLDGLYAFMIRSAIGSQYKKRQGTLETVITMLEDLRETWVQAIEIKNKENASQKRVETTKETHFASSSI